MKNRLTAKDLITVGIMVVLTMVAFMISGILGNIPILMPLIPFLRNTWSFTIFSC